MTENLAPLHEKLDHLTHVALAPNVVIRDAAGKPVGIQKAISADAMAPRPLTLDEHLQELHEIGWWSSAFHEASHLCVGLVQGSKPLHACIMWTETGGHHGRVNFAIQETPPFPYPIEYWLPGVRMQLAGGIGELKFLRDFGVKHDTETVLGQCKSDRKVSTELLVNMMKLSDDALSRAIDQSCSEARKLLSDNWHRVMSVAYALHTFRKLDGAQIQFAYDHPHLARGAADGMEAAYEKLRRLIDGMSAPSVIERDAGGLVIGSRKQIGALA